MRDPAQDAAITLAHLVATAPVDEVVDHLLSLYSWKQRQPMVAWLDSVRYGIE